MSRSIELSKFQFGAALGIHLNLIVIVSNFTRKSKCFLLISIRLKIDSKLRINPIVNHECNPSEYSWSANESVFLQHDFLVPRAGRFAVPTLPIEISFFTQTATNAPFWLITASSDCSDPTNFTIYATKQSPTWDNQVRHEYIRDLLLSRELFTRFEGVRFSLSVKIFHGFSSACLLRFCFTFVVFLFFFCFLSHWTWISMRCVKWNTRVGVCRSSTAGSDQFLISIVNVSSISVHISHIQRTFSEPKP